MMVTGKKLLYKTDFLGATCLWAGFLLVLMALVLPVNGQAQSSTMKKYYGQRITLDFQNADIVSVLSLISEVSNLNILTSDRVRGRVTIKLKDVPWDQALDLILRTNGLGQIQEGNILRIAPIEDLMKEELNRLSQERAKEKQIPLTVELIHVNYAQVADMQRQVNSILSDRGEVNLDERTNVLIVKDTPEKVASAANLVESLDTQTPQVLIEARIIEASSNMSRALGIQWGGHYLAGSQMGNATGLAFPNSVFLYGSQPGNFVVSLPAAAGTGQGGALGISLGSINHSAQVDMILTAFESEGKGKIIANPKIVTMDNTQAMINSGMQIPMTTITAGAAGSTATVGESMQNALLQLGVTPHVTSDEYVLLKIQLQKTTVNSSFRSPLGNPALDQTQVQSEALVKDSETLVIGGILNYQNSETQSGVPYLSSVPVLGYLFKNFNVSESRKEMMIFITPTIIRQKPAI
jgi:type IV pilus assembly protein PilQ